MKGFRVWSNYWKKYATEAELYMDGSADAIFEDADGVPHHENTDIVVEFNTGLKDKNGKEIYEGDIVRNTVEVAPNKSSTYKIYYDQHHAMYAMSPVDGKIDIGDFYGYIMRRHFEVIGNVHENGDLLKEEE